MERWLPEGAVDLREDAPAAAGRGAALAPLLRRLAGRALDVILPPVCLACRTPVASESGLCFRCWSGLNHLAPPWCARLGTPLPYDAGPGALSGEAVANPPPYDRARAAVAYGEVARRLVFGLKYHDRQEIAALLGRMAAHAGREILADAELLLPVPLHRRRLWQRRFNQAAAIAAAAGRVAGVPVDVFALERVRATPRQVGLDAAARADNVRGAFRVAEARRPVVEGRRVVVVDDVLTTGATVAAVTRALRRAKAARVDVLVFARVLTGEEGFAVEPFADQAGSRGGVERP